MRSQSSCRDNRRGCGAPGYGGFTMIEIVIVVVILALLSSVAVPVLSRWTGTVRFREITLGVASDLRLGRTTALEENRETRFELDVSGKRYRLSKGNLPSGSTVWTELRPWEELAPDADWATGTACRGLKFTEIGFKADGSSEGGVVCIKDPSGADRFRVVVSSASGRVSVQ